MPPRGDEPTNIEPGHHWHFNGFVSFLKADATCEICAGERTENYPFQERRPVPAEIAVCPYCGAPLEAEADEWEDVDGDWLPVDVKAWCTAEPGDVEDDAWDEWWEAHRDMPYVIQLPVDEKVLAWTRRAVLTGQVPT